MWSAPGPSWAPTTAGDGHPLLLLTGDISAVPLCLCLPGPDPGTPESRQGGGQLSRAGRRLPACLPPWPAAERRSSSQRCSGHGRSSNKGKWRAGPGSWRTVPGLAGTWPQGLAVAEVHASCSPCMAGSPAAEGGCWAKSADNEAKRASLGACWSLGWQLWDTPGTLQTADRGGRWRDLGATGRGGITYHYAPWPKPHGCGTGAREVAPGPVGPTRAGLVCQDLSLLGPWQGWTCSLALAPAPALVRCPPGATGCEQMAPLPPAGRRQPLAGGTPLPCFPSPFVCLHRARKSHGGGERAAPGARGPAGAVPGVRTAMWTCPLLALFPATPARCPNPLLALAIAPARGLFLPLQR